MLGRGGLGRSNPVEPAFGWRFDMGWVEPEGVYSPQMRVGVVRSNRADHSNPLRRRLGSVRGGVGDGREAELAGAGAGGAPALPSSPAQGRAGGGARRCGGGRSHRRWGAGGGARRAWGVGRGAEPPARPSSPARGRAGRATGARGRAEARQRAKRGEVRRRSGAGGGLREERPSGAGRGDERQRKKGKGKEEGE